MARIRLKILKFRKVWVVNLYFEERIYMYRKLTRNNIRPEIWLLVRNIQSCMFCRPPKRRHRKTAPIQGAYYSGFVSTQMKRGQEKISTPGNERCRAKMVRKNNNPRNWLLCEEFRHNKFCVWLLHCDCPHPDACFYSNYLIIIVDSMAWKKSKFHGRIRKESANSFDCVSWKYRMMCLFLFYLVRKPTSVIFSELCSRRIFQKMDRSEML